MILFFHMEELFNTETKESDAQTIEINTTI